MMGPDEIRETLDKADELVTELRAQRNLSPDSGNVTQITFDGGKSIMASWIVGLACGVCLGVAVMASVWVGWALSDIRADIRERNQDQGGMNTWTAQEIAAVRSYITTGKLAPMKPRPTEESKDATP